MRAGSPAPLYRVACSRTWTRRAKLDAATVVVVFLPGEAYAVLFPTLRTHLRSGTRVMSHGFFFPQCLPDTVEILPYDRINVAHLYLWQVTETPDHILCCPP